MDLIKGKKTCLIVLIVYIIVALSCTVLTREPAEHISRLDLIKDYTQLNDDSYRDILVNIVLFIPIGMLVGMMSGKYGLLKAILLGMVFSLTIECSQLIWKRGTFDVNDIFNNVVGAALGGLVAILVMGLYKKC